MEDDIETRRVIPQVFISSFLLVNKEGKCNE